jgi:two-component system chemotaxis response regulator CheY
MGYNILIVDDSGTMRKIISRTIMLTGLPVDEMFNAEHGRQALDLMKQKDVSLVITDINMPVMDGITMLEKMAEDEVMKKLPVVIISTEGSETKLERLSGKGVKAFIRKPFTPEKVRDTLQVVLGGAYAQ